ncbi:hypothetical protein ACFSTJ_20705 [Ottowia pentelensis]|uniref:hypothetical protein n=1 Tax=Ottowia pentelensis TaxID=511108 RepID=UPI003632BAD7
MTQTLRLGGFVFLLPKKSHAPIDPAFSAAVIALVIGGWPALSRVYRAYVLRSEQAARQQLLTQETAQLKAELQANKPALLAELQRLQAAGLHQEVLTKASRYRLADDPDVRAIYTRSAQALSLQQTLAKLARLATEHCNDTEVRRHLQEVMATVQPPGTPPPAARGRFAGCQPTLSSHRFSPSCARQPLPRHPRMRRNTSMIHPRRRWPSCFTPTTTPICIRRWPLP